eukprot:343130_1
MGARSVSMGARSISLEHPKLDRMSVQYGREECQHGCEEYQSRTPKVIVKVGMLGDSHIGLKSLMVKYIEDNEYLPDTLGVTFMEKTVTVKSCDVLISIWHLYTKKEIEALLHLVCSDAKAIIFGFDLTQKSSLFSVKAWYKKARKENKIFMSFLVGCKYDLFAELEVNYKMDITKQARKYAKKMRAPLIYTSSAQNMNVKRIFKIIIDKVFDYNNFAETNEWLGTDYQCIVRMEMKKKVFTVFGYMRRTEIQYKWYNIIPLHDLTNIILIYYGYKELKRKDDKKIDGDGKKKTKCKKKKKKKKQKCKKGTDKTDE